MIINEPFPRHLNEVSRFPQIYKGGRKKKRSVKYNKNHSIKRKSNYCRCKSCKKCKRKKCTRKCNTRKK